MAGDDLGSKTKKRKEDIAESEKIKLKRYLIDEIKRKRKKY